MAFSLLNFVNEIGSLNPFWWFTKTRSQLRFRFFPDRKHKSFLGKKNRKTQLLTRFDSHSLCCLNARKRFSNLSFQNIDFSDYEGRHRPRWDRAPPSGATPNDELRKGRLQNSVAAPEPYLRKLKRND